MLRRIVEIAAREATRRRARPGPRPGPRPGIGPRPGPGGNAEIQRGVRSIARGLSRRRRGL